MLRCCSELQIWKLLVSSSLESKMTGRSATWDGATWQWTVVNSTFFSIDWLGIIPFICFYLLKKPLSPHNLVWPFFMACTCHDRVKDPGRSSKSSKLTKCQPYALIGLFELWQEKEKKPGNRRHRVPLPFEVRLEFWDDNSPLNISSNLWEWNLRW
jgi:hypothetical protein